MLQGPCRPSASPAEVFAQTLFTACLLLKLNPCQADIIVAVSTRDTNTASAPPDRDSRGPFRRNRPVHSMIEAIGEKTIESIVNTGRFARFMGRALNQSAVSILQPRCYSLIWTQMFTIGVRSVPVIMVTGAFVGMVLAVQAYDQLAGMGLEERLGVLINIAVVKELGPVLAAVMLAGRVGGALTAELGTMNVTEQIAAVQSMGTDPIKYLVSPRFLACLILTPFLIVYADLLGILGGYFVSVIQLDINSRAYWDFSAQGVALWDLSTGILKGFFFGGAIAMISCYKGFTCREGAQGVGEACTEAFVGSFITILALNFIFAVVMKAIYSTFWPVQSLL
jgi:phospholipid/cholesterol/gamma-HCH transport system permease protein